MNRLDVWAGDILAAELVFTPEGRFALDYAEAWRTHPGAFPFSPCLPFEAGGQSPDRRSAAVRNFFANLLPEGRALEEALAIHRLARGNVFGLLARLGGDTAGALRLLPPGQAPESEPVLREVTPEELSGRIRERPARSFTIWDERTRLSIAGFQDKLAVYQDGAGRFFLADGAAASTHLIKPEAIDPRPPCLPANEHFCLALAARCGLPVARAELRRLPETVLIVERYDRGRLPDGRTRRLHQIDACQALGLAPDYKYEEPFGIGTAIGASLPEVFALADLGLAPAPMRMALLRWVLFQALIGNTDAHAKNMSFFVERGGLSPTPAYDLVCGTVYGFDRLAMRIGDEFRPDQLGAFQWALFAHECGIPVALLGREMARLAKSVRRAVPGLLRSAIYTNEESGLLERVAALALARADQFADLASGVRQVRREDLV